MDLILHRVLKVFPGHINAKSRIEGNVLHLNALSWFTNNVIEFRGTIIPIYMVSPYFLRTGGIDSLGNPTTEDYLFENVWQGSSHSLWLW
jgi:hypothetical protein